MCPILNRQLEELLDVLVNGRQGVRLPRGSECPSKAKGVDTKHYGSRTPRTSRSTTPMTL